jgi:hypothetical protein
VRVPDFLEKEDVMAGMVKGPAIFLAQFAGDAAPFNSLSAICEWAASLGYKGVQIPTWDARLFDLTKAAESQTYAEEIKGFRRICKDSWSRSTPPMTTPSTPLRRPRFTASPASVSDGRSSR